MKAVFVLIYLEIFLTRLAYSSLLFHYVFAYSICLCVCVCCSYFRLKKFFFFFFENKNLFPSGLMCFSFYSRRLFIVLHCFLAIEKDILHSHTHNTHTYTHSIVNNLTKWLEDREKEMEFANPHFVSPSKCKLSKNVSVQEEKKKVLLLRTDKCHTLCIFFFHILFLSMCERVYGSVCVVNILRELVDQKKKKIFTSVKKYINFDTVSPPPPS